MQRLFVFIYQKAEGDIMNSCFYCKKRLLCDKFQTYTSEFEKEVFLLEKMLIIGMLLFEEKINILQSHQGLNFFSYFETAIHC